VTQGIVPAANISYPDLSLIAGPPISMAQDEESNSDMTDATSPSNEPSSSSKTSKSSRRGPRKAAWGVTRDPGQPSNTGRHSSRIKDKEKQDKSRRRNSYPSNSTGPQLRGVRARPRMEAGNNTEAEGLPPSRLSHNIVEKQYRTRLNMQFTSLLDAIPPEMLSTQFDGYVDTSARKGKVSKGEVLALAKRYIQSLEQDTKTLERENREHKQSISRLKAAWEKNGGRLLLWCEQEA